jgi:small subunit ribosomal protein S3Ae
MVKTATTKKKARRKIIDSWKTKEWYDVYAPKTFKEAYLGSIPSADPDSLVNRVLEVLLYDITGNFKHTFIKLKFKITNVSGNRADTRFWGHELTRDFIRSMIHRGSSRIDGIFNFATADKFVYRVSTFVITRRRAKQSQKKTMRKIIRQVISEFAKNMPHDKFIRGIIYGKFSVNIMKIAKTIYPLKECQIRKVKVVSMPEGVGDEFFGEDDEQVDEIGIHMDEHGKSLKSKKQRQKKRLTEEAEAAAAAAQQGTPPTGEAAKPEGEQPPPTEEKKE